VCARILEDLEGLLAALLDVVVNFTFCTAALAAEACDADFCDTARCDADNLCIACEFCVAKFDIDKCDADRCSVACELYIACCVFQ